MKTMIFSFKTIAMVLFSVLAFTLTSCGDDNNTPDVLLEDAIVGTWNVTSYKVESDEYIGLIFASASLHFEALNGDEGEFEQEVGFLDGESVSITGNYTVDNDAHKITMEYDGDIVVATVQITDNKLNWDGTQEGFPLVMKATRQ